VEFCIGCGDASDVEMEVAMAAKALRRGGGGLAAVAEVLLGESAMFGGLGSGCTRLLRTDSRSTGTILRVGSAVRC
jgi:hypothetical protein